MASIFRTTRLVTILGAVAQAAGFARTIVVAFIFGVALEVDAYNLALIPLTLISVVLGSWLQISFVGRYAALVAKREPRLSASYRSQMLLLVVACTIVAAGACFVSAPLIAKLLVPVDRGTLAKDVTEAIQITGLILVPTIVGDFMAFILNCHGRFLLASIAPILNAIVSVAGLLLWKNPGLAALVLTLGIGSAAQWAVVLAGLIRLRLSWSFKSITDAREIIESISLALPLLPAIFLANLSTAIVTSKCSQIGEGAVAIYGYASRLHGGMTQIMITGLSTVLLPHFAAQWSIGKQGEVAFLLRRLARMCTFASVCTLLAIYSMGDDALILLLRRGAFSEQYASRVNEIWLVVSFSLLPLAFGTIIAKLCQALRGAFPMLLSGGIAFSATLVTAHFGAYFDSLALIAGSAATSATVGLIFWLAWLSKRLPVGPMLGDMLAAFLRALTIWLPAVGCVYLTSLLITGLPLVVRVAIQTPVYFGVASFLLFATRSFAWFFYEPSEAK